MQKINDNTQRHMNQFEIPKVELSSSPSLPENNNTFVVPPSRACNPMVLNFNNDMFGVELGLFSPSPPLEVGRKKTKRNRSISCPVHIEV